MDTRRGKNMTKTIRPQLEIILPVFNEQEVIPSLVNELDQVLEPLRKHFSINFLFVNDGSTDQTFGILMELADRRTDIRVVNLLHNFGHSAAVQAGLDHFEGNLCILMDADMQDSPNVIPEMVDKWKRGAKTVVVERGERSENNRWAFRLFYKLYHRLARQMPSLDFGTFSLLDASTVERLKKLSEQSRYFPGLVAYASGPLASVKAARRPRGAGNSRVGMGGLVSLAITACLSFSHLPIRMVSLLGIISSFVALAFGCGIIAVKIFTVRAIPGWASIMTATAMGSGIQLLCIGLMGEYLSRIYQEVKSRPLYFVGEVIEKGAKRKAA